MTDKITTLLAGLSVTIALAVFGYTVNRVDALEEKQITLETRSIARSEFQRLEDKLDKRFDTLDTKIEQIRQAVR